EPGALPGRGGAHHARAVPASARGAARGRRTGGRLRRPRLRPPLLRPPPRRPAGGRPAPGVVPGGPAGKLVGIEALDLATGSPVVLYLEGPKEKIWGILLSLTPAGVVVRGLDLTVFDDWMRQ